MDEMKRLITNDFKLKIKEQYKTYVGGFLKQEGFQGVRETLTALENGYIADRNMDNKFLKSLTTEQLIQLGALLHTELLDAENNTFSYLDEFFENITKLQLGE